MENVTERTIISDPTTPQEVPNGISHPAGPYISSKLRTHLPQSPKDPAYIRPYRLPLPKGIRIPVTSGIRCEAYIPDSETLWRTQYNSRRSSGEAMAEPKSCMEKKGVKGAVKKVRFVEMVKYVGENESDDRDLRDESDDTDWEDMGTWESEEIPILTSGKQ